VEKADFAMKKVLKKFRTLVVIGVAFWVALIPAYLYLSALDNFEPNSPRPCFKTDDQDFSASTFENKGKILVSNFSVKRHSESDLFFEHISYFSHCVIALRARPLFLRC
jgi:hypothetical protein